MTTPWITPSSPRIGAALSSMGRRSPSFEVRTVWFASPTTVSRRRTSATGFSTTTPVASFEMRNTSSIGFRLASIPLHPVSTSAARFMKLMRPAASVAMTASPMLWSVVENHRACLPSCSRDLWSSRCTAMSRMRATVEVAANRLMVQAMARRISRSRRRRRESSFAWITAT